MIAAIYVRKSTEQNGVADEEKSVTRQIEHARAFALLKGWRVAEEHVYADDGISGAEFANRPGFVRLMNALKPRPPFQALIMSEESRLGREQIEVSYALKQLVTSGVRVFCYLTDTERTLDSPIEKAMLALQTMADEMERARARQRTYDALARKARAGHVTGGRVFGYDNIRVDGHVERRVNETEAVVVQRIYEQYAGGYGLPTIAHMLNSAGVATPRAQQGRVGGWCPASVREILKRPLYRGEIQWNRARKRDSWGQTNWSKRPESEWMRIAAPELRIVPPELSDAVDARRAAMMTRALRFHDGRLIGRPVGRPPGEGSPYLLTGLLTCGVCGGGMEVLSSSSGGGRRFHYRCYVARRKGPSRCTNTLAAPMADADLAVLAAVEQTLMHPDVVARAIAHAEAAQLRDRDETSVAGLEAELKSLAVASRRLTAAIEEGGQLAPLVAAIDVQERRRKDVEARLTAARTPRPSANATTLRATLEGYLTDWRGLLRGHVHQGQQVLRRLIVGRVTFTPEAEGYYRFAGSGTVKPLLGGVIRNLASPAGFEPALPA
jgi:site-specific DNA recombinase